jgi:hypothetical protein
MVHVILSIFWDCLTQEIHLWLAELVLSFVPNSVSVERLFSSMGDTKSKKQTHLGVQKNPDISFLKIELRRQHAIDGTAQCRLKCQFGNPETVTDCDPTGSRMEDQELIMNTDADTLLTDSDSDNSDADGDCDVETKSNSSPSSSFSAVARQMLQDANDNNNEDYISGLRETIGKDILGHSEGSRPRQVSEVSMQTYNTLTCY